MLQTKEKKPTAMAVDMTEAPAFSGEFLDVMTAYSYETLREHLLKTKASKDALALLDTIIGLQMARRQMECARVEYTLNLEVGSMVATVSRSVIGLGGYFLGPTLVVNSVRQIK